MLFACNDKITSNYLHHVHTKLLPFIGSYLMFGWDFLYSLIFKTSYQKNKSKQTQQRVSTKSNNKSKPKINVM